MKKNPLHRQGAIAPFAVFIIVVMLAMVAFSVDIGYLNLARTQLQLAADAAAMGGALGLPDGPVETRLLAQTAAQANFAAGSPVVLVTQEDVELGTWDGETFQFSPLTGADESNANSVRVTCRRTTARGNPISLFFAKIIGANFADLSASAVARRQGVCGTFIGIESINLNGTGAYTDSYDSSIGSYLSQPAGNKGNLCSNGPISVQNGDVNGDALPGSGYSVSIGSQGSVSGSTTPRTEQLNLPPVDFADVATNNDNDVLTEPPYVSASTEFKHNSGDLYLPPGTYYFTNFSITGGPVRIDGPVNIYVLGDVSTSGASIVNETNVPENLKIFAEGKDVRISGSSDFFGYVYAPSSDIVVAGSASFFGGAVGKTLKFHNEGGIHADEALKVLGGFPARPRLVQ